MKLVTAIVNKEDSKAVCNELLRSHFYVTRLATTGRTTGYRCLFLR